MHMISQQHTVNFKGGKVVLHLDTAPESVMLPSLIEPLMRAAEEIGNALDTEGRDSEDEKGDHSGSEEGVERDG
jgi:hypothetical protein